MLIFCKRDWQADCCQIKAPSGCGYWSWQSPIIYGFLLQLLIIYFPATEGKPAAKENWWTHHADMTLLEPQIAILYTWCKEEWSVGTGNSSFTGILEKLHQTFLLSHFSGTWWYIPSDFHLVFSSTQWPNSSETSHSKLLVYTGTGS